MIRCLPARAVSLAGAWFLAVISGLAGGCAVYLDPGPNPARLAVSAQASVTPAMVEEALELKAHLKYKVLGGVEEVSDPLWDLRAFVPRADGGLTPLQPMRPVENIVGHDFAATAEFLAPPGVYEVFFLLECSVRHVSLAGPRPVVEYIYILTWRLQREMEFCPGCQVQVSPFKDYPRRP